MAGTGVTKLGVRVARDKLIAEGKHASARSVREVLGTGSLSTILRFLKDIEAESGETFGVGGMVHSQLCDVTMNLHNRLQDMAQATVAKGDAEAAERISTVETMLKAEQEAHKQSAGLLKEATKNLNSLTLRYEDMVKQLNEANVTIGRQDEQLVSERKIHEKQLTRIGTLEHDLHLKSSQYDHLQAHTQSLMAEAQKTHDEALASVQRQNDHLTTKNFEYNSMIATLNLANSQLIAEARTNARELDICQESLTAVIAELKNAQGLLESQKLTVAAQEGQLSLLIQQLEATRSHHTEAEDRSRAHAQEAERLRSTVDNQLEQISAMMAVAVQQARKED